MIFIFKLWFFKLIVGYIFNHMPLHRFMVELYKHNYMHLNVIYQCVITLLQMNTEEAVLCLCIILSFTGKYLIQVRFLFNAVQLSLISFNIIWL